MTYSMILPDRSILVMPEGMQKEWLHTIPRVSGCLQPRINITFRQIKGANV
jgi:alkylated DNA repair dioxygenase AlkB